MTLIALCNRTFGLGGGTPQLHQQNYGVEIDSTELERQRLCSGVVTVKTVKMNANNIPANENVRFAMAA